MNRSTLARLFQPYIIISAAAVIAVVSVAVVFAMEHQTPSNSYVSPTTGDLTEEVNATGTIKPAESVDLSFTTSGTISHVSVDVGSQVGAGQTLAVLNGADLAAQVEQAKAALAMQQAKLQGLQAGATAASVAASQTGVTNAQTAVLQAKQGIVQASADAYVKADDAIHNKVDQFIQNGRTVNPSLTIIINDSQAQQNILSGRVAMETLLAQWQTYQASLPADASSVDTDTLEATTAKYLSQVGAYLNEVAAGLNEAIPTTAYPLSTIQGYQASIATARTNISSDVTALNAAQSALTTAESGLASAQAALTVTQAPASASDIAAQEAAIASAQASVDAAEAGAAKTVLSAPIAGTITVNNAHVGAVASPGVPVFSLDSNAQFQIEAYVSETDVAKVKVGDIAQVSLDAYPDIAPLSAHVIEIDPAATVQNGVSAYKVTLQFDTNDPQEKAGLTANVNITAASAQNALSVPTSAIITEGDQKYVMKQIGSGEQLAPVTVGISSDNGFTQVTSGISASDKVRAFGAQQ